MRLLYFVKAYWLPQVETLPKAPKDEGVMAGVPLGGAALTVAGAPKGAGAEPKDLSLEVVEDDEGLNGTAVVFAETPEVGKVGVAVADADGCGLTDTDRGFERVILGDSRTLRKPERTVCQIGSVGSEYEKCSENTLRPSELTNSKCTCDRSE
jgi:hypothetical protein